MHLYVQVCMYVYICVPNYVVRRMDEKVLDSFCYSETDVLKRPRISFESSGLHNEYIFYSILGTIQGDEIDCFMTSHLALRPWCF